MCGGGWVEIRLVFMFSLVRVCCLCYRKIWVWLGNLGMKKLMCSNGKFLKRGCLNWLYSVGDYLSDLVRMVIWCGGRNCLLCVFVCVGCF